VGAVALERLDDVVHDPTLDASGLQVSRTVAGRSATVMRALSSALDGAGLV